LHSQRCIAADKLPLGLGQMLRAAKILEHLRKDILIKPERSGAVIHKLARCICLIAFGRQPNAVTSGSTAEELEKRIASELIDGSPALFLDNLNNTAFRSNLLASAITERPSRVRVLGRSKWYH
jgi:hypothetical protein